MRDIRIIPVLLIHNGGLVKSVKFDNYKYVGDPINAVRIFNEKEVDEICILNIDNSKQKTTPNISLIGDIISEAFMPVSYGGGISNLRQAEELFYNGVEKVVLNYAAITQPSLITEIARVYGSQSVVVSIDYKNNWLGKSKVYTLNGTQTVAEHPVSLVKKVQDLGAGEIMLNSIDRDGTFTGYDINMIEQVRAVCRVPIIACGGAGSINDFEAAILAGADALAAGSMFVFQGRHRAVLINYPSRKDITNALGFKKTN